MTGRLSSNVGTHKQGKDKVGLTTNLSVTGKHTANNPMYPRTGIIKTDSKNLKSNSNGNPAQGSLAPNPGLPQRMVVPLHSCKRVANRTAGPRGGSANLDYSLQLQSQRLEQNSHSRITEYTASDTGRAIEHTPCQRMVQGAPTTAGASDTGTIISGFTARTWS
jgi:hypothetical protein